MVRGTSRAHDVRAKYGFRDAARACRVFRSGHESTDSINSKEHKTMNATFPQAPIVEASDDSQSNAQILSDLYDAFASGDVEAALQAISTDFVLHVPGIGRNAGEYWGPEGFRKFMSNIATYNGGLFDL